MIRHVMLPPLWYCFLAGLLGLLIPTVGYSEPSPPSISAENGPSIRPLVDSLRGPLAGLEQSLFDDAADGALDRLSLFEAALIADGVVQPEVLRHYQSQLDRLVEELQKTGRLTDSTQRNAEILFQFLHKHALRGGYRLSATDLRESLDHGRYNCVSATVLYLCLAQRLGIRCCGLQSTGHALCRVFLPDGPLDMETTCPGWLGLDHDPRRATGAAPKILGPAGVDGTAPVREVTPLELTAMIYYNRGVDLLRDKRYSAAAAANAKSLTLDPLSRTARGNLLATINNWSIALGEQSRFAEAADLLRRGLACDPYYAPFIQNIAYIQHRWTTSRDGKNR
ncbi:MAG: hypothetical protein JXB10_09150 [Pirellulales bacterium]|nr:hypothetical protein [Pirellulales bacterium]